MENLKKIQLTKWHADSGAKMVPFAGYFMPVQYTSIVEEHSAVRNSAGIFDVSHMGRMWFRGKDAQKFLDIIVPRDVTKADIGRVIYSFALSEKATFKDDLVISRIKDNEFLLVWNAGNYEKIKTWVINLSKVVKRFNSSFDLDLEDVTESSALFALQGPNAKIILESISKEVPGRWKVVETTIDDLKVIISGTGYTGENGYEIMVINTTVSDNSKALKVWELLLNKGKQHGLIPTGLGARDSLRLEAGFPLYGNDIDEDTNPVEADLVFGPPFVHLEKEGYSFGMEKLKILANIKPKRLRTGFISTSRKAPRHGMKLYLEDKEVGIITSGAFAPTIGKGMGMGYVDNDLAKNFGTQLIAKEGRKEVAIILSKMPLYDKSKFGHTRKVS